VEAITESYQLSSGQAICGGVVTTKRNLSHQAC
jgi:hypothetical protein